VNVVKVIDRYEERGRSNLFDDRAPKEVQGECKVAEDLQEVFVC